MSTKSTTKKSSVTTEIVLGAAAQQITKAVAELNAASKSVNELASKAEDLTLAVANKEQQIEELDVTFKEKERQLSVNLDLSFKADTDRVVNEYLKSSGKVSILSRDYDSLVKELSDTKSGLDSQTKSSVAAATASIKTQHENEIKLIHSENKAVAAENVSKVVSLTREVVLLQEQLGKMHEQINAERQASIQRAQAASVGAINVTAAGK